MAEDKKKKGFFDFLKNKNVKKLEEKGFDRYGGRKDKKEEDNFKKIGKMVNSKNKYKDGGVAKKGEYYQSDSHVHKVDGKMTGPGMKKKKK